MTGKVECEIAIAMNEDGDWVVCKWEDDAIDLLNEEVGGAAARIVKVTVVMLPPVVPAARVNVGDAAGETVEVTAE